ncbi:Protein of unknown function [Pyronema omphalodes CBS 100304]|uniref:Uncharacterized protein n=1 Tax=Pyronema omphalodes (strain CBS 100304) TaxID=1076935 RepID=U4LD20_PYROM|nr:Protein of unknown function [Pyronema omphalodes CBS 100304]
MSPKAASLLYSPPTCPSADLFDLRLPFIKTESSRLHPTTSILSLPKMTLANITNRGNRRAAVPRVNINVNNASSEVNTPVPSSENAAASLPSSPIAVHQNPVDLYHLALSLLQATHSLSSDDMKVTWYRPLEGVKCWGDNYNVPAGEINEVVSSGSAIGKLVMKNLNIVVDVCMEQIKRKVGDAVGPRVLELQDAEEDRINRLKGVTRELFCATGDIEDEQDRLKYNETTDDEQEEEVGDISSSDISEAGSSSDEESDGEILRRMQKVQEYKPAPTVPSSPMKRKAPKKGSKRAPKRRVRFQEPKKKAAGKKN